MAKLCLIFILNLFIILILSSIISFNASGMLQEHFGHEIEVPCVNSRTWTEKGAATVQVRYR
ncbi:hypothetical protein C9I99_00810 [Photobacterium lutimaris]|uniref:Transmembrane protein n=1 Tax=Photobacterium lutimaris TaxID=388278 RepID=A0A2T3J2S4_9GAMM|nr:hypothetical protein C9I99_00810 [Photobacterium lutimaris]TDR78647.1 hypothetical protein DFP78_101159 [Photobacterium lutimaris]